MTLRVALDHNFPVPIVQAVARAIVEAEVRPIRDIDPRLPLVDDDVLVHALASRGWDILVTCDRHMLSLPTVLARVLDTKLSLVVAMGQGHDPVAATGLVLAHLPHLAARHVGDRAQVWRLRVGRRPHEEPWAFLEKLAERAGTSARTLYDAHRLSLRTLAQDPLE